MQAHKTHSRWEEGLQAGTFHSMQHGMAPDVDIGLCKGRKHGGSHALAAGHLVAHSRQHAAVVNLLHLADALRSYGFPEAARSWKVEDSVQAMLRLRHITFWNKTRLTVANFGHEAV